MDTSTKTEYYHSMTTPHGRYRFEEWSDGWRLYKMHKDGVEILKTNINEDEMFNIIKLLRS